MFWGLTLPGSWRKARWRSDPLSRSTGVAEKTIEAFKPRLRILICTGSMLTGNLSASETR